MMLQKIARINLLIILSLGIFACAQNPEKLNDVSEKSTSSQATDIVDSSQGDESTQGQGMANIPPALKEVLTSEQIANLGKDLNLTDEQLKKLEKADFSLTQMMPEGLLKLLSPEQINRIKRGNDPQITQEQEKKFMAEMGESMNAKLVKFGTLAPDFELKDNYGKTRKLSDFRGKYVVIDFWGTWCPPCVKALPKILKAYKQVDKSKVEFIGICTGCENFAKFVKERNLSWVQLEDEPGETADSYGVSGFPTMLLIDPDGKVIDGGIGSDLENDIIAGINKHMN